VAGVSNPTILVIGAGPGLGASVARAFGDRGYDVGLVARDEGQLAELGKTLQAGGVTTGWAAADITDPTALTAAVERLAGHTGRVDVLHFNPSVFRQKDPLQLSPDELLEDVRAGVGGLLTAVQAARPFMSTGGRVTATGSMAADQPWNQAASLGVQKAALRNLVRSLDTTLEPDGIRAVSVTVRGTLERGTAFDPDRVAEAIYAAAVRDGDGWKPEVSYSG
jgi:NAD(P)-dependent dehydrogenase (short-subunit alcohol dehydrogenase family)